MQDVAWGKTHLHNHSHLASCDLGLSPQGSMSIDALFSLHFVVHRRSVCFRWQTHRKRRVYEEAHFLSFHQSILYCFPSHFFQRVAGCYPLLKRERLAGTVTGTSPRRTDGARVWVQMQEGITAEKTTIIMPKSPFQKLSRARCYIFAIVVRQGFGLLGHKTDFALTKSESGSLFPKRGWKRCLVIVGLSPAQRADSI